MLLLGLLLIVVLAARVAARSLPRLGGWVLPLMALGAALLQARLAFDVLVPAAAIVGWSALVLGGPGREPR